jgi:hypothetical protein
MVVRKYLSAAIPLTALVLCLPATAGVLGTLDVQYVDQGADRLVTNQGDLDGDLTYEASEYGSAGVYHHLSQNPTGEGLLLPGPDLWTFCVEPDQGVPTTLQTYDVRPVEDGPQGTSWLSGPLTATQANALRELWGRFFDPIWITTGFPDPENDNAAGFGVAIKEIIYESAANPLDATAGRFRLDPADAIVAGVANTYLAQLTGDSGFFADLRLLTNPDYQDFLVQVPEPATLVLMTLGGLMVLKLRRLT